MIAINLDHVTVTYIAQPIFRELSWEIHSDRCVGLIGPNGCGKSTLLRLIAGDLTSDTGFVVRQNGLKFGYLPQEPRLTPEQTVLQEALGASSELIQIERKLNEVESQLGEPTVYTNERKLAQVLEQQARLLEEYTRLGGLSYEGRVRAILQNVGFTTEADLNLLIATLSGGQKKLLGLAKLLITQPDILLLDEPDNHLDLAGKALLEKLINEHQGATIIVSHDRYLLDLVVDEIVEMEDGRLIHYPGDYSEYVFEKRMNQLRQQQLFQAQQKEINRLEESANRLLTWGRLYDNNKFIRRGKSILKRLEKIDRIEQPKTDRRRMGLELGGWRGSNKVLEITELDKIFPANANNEETIVLAGLNLLIWHGQRVGLVGPNGAGKSVLFRLILEQDTPSGGKIAKGPSVEIGYYAQEHETLDYKRSLLDTVRQAEKLSESQAVSFLGKFLFDYEKARGPVSALSGGERSRLQMALLMLTKANFLLLDEPTNNLDIASAEVLEDALEDFEGTVFVISHDRYFLDRVADHIVELVDGRLVEYVGGYSDYLAAKSKRKKQLTKGSH
ncbi:MAG: ABC-F family ATP-binding cassette domain-containing protein [Chloroflexi bacterium]|nr:ABC-F family ATP-binding cassette domain-containing protein [Chloroflexota bacterium]